MHFFTLIYSKDKRLFRRFNPLPPAPKILGALVTFDLATPDSLRSLAYAKSKVHFSQSTFADTVYLSM